MASIHAAGSLLAVATTLCLVRGSFYGQTPGNDAHEIQLETSKAANSGSAASLGGQPDGLLQQAESLLDRGLLNEADRGVRQYLDKHPNSARGHFLLGRILFKEVKPKESLAEYTEGFKYHDPSVFDLKIVALDFALLADYADADKWLTRSLKWDPKDSQGWYYLGCAKYNENKFEEAMSAFKQCLNLDPKNVKAEDNLGLSYEGLGHTDEAFTAYRRAIAWQEQMLDKNPVPFIDLGSLLLKQNRVEEAIPYFLQAVEISPQESRAHEQLGKAYLQLNQLQKAQDELEKAVALAPKSAPLHFMLGQVYRKEGLTQKAKFELDRASVLNGTHSSPGSPDP